MLWWQWLIIGLVLGAVGLYFLLYLITPQDFNEELRDWVDEWHMAQEALKEKN